MRFKVLISIPVLLLSSACSLYQSDGRKFLEKSALEYAASANLQSCGLQKMDEEWLRVSKVKNADVYGSEKEEFALRVVPTGTEALKIDDTPYSCTYHFDSVQEMIERTDSAVELTLAQWPLG